MDTSNYINKCLILKESDYTNINGWRVSIKLPEELPCDLLDYLRGTLNAQKDAYYKLELYLAYKIDDNINYALLCTRKTSNTLEQKLCAVIISNNNIVDLISFEVKRIIRCENKCVYDCCHCYKQRSMEECIPEYYYLTNRMFWAICSSNKSVPITISKNALRILYKTIKSYFIPIVYTNDYLYSNNQPGLRAYPTAVNDTTSDFEISPTTS